MIPVFDVHGMATALELDPELPGVDAAAFEAELREELACFPPTPEAPPAARLRVRPLALGERLADLGAAPGWMGAHVTPEFWIRWRVAPLEAEVLVHRPPRLAELVLAVWARVVTARRFAGTGEPLASFHAASMAGPAGGLLLLGESGAGKTTLSAALTHRTPGPGLAYLGDEDALVAEPGGELALLALPRRLRLLHLLEAERAAGARPVEAFGESAWLLARPPSPTQSAPLTRVVLLEPDPAATAARLEPLPRDQLAYALLRGLERFPPHDAGDGAGAALLAAANRAGFAVVSRLVAACPGHRLRYAQPGGFPAAAAALAALLGAP